jgi:hypothetical protein
MLTGFSFFKDFTLEIASVINTAFRLQSYCISDINFKISLNISLKMAHLDLNVLLNVN